MIQKIINNFCDLLVTAKEKQNLGDFRNSIRKYINNPPLYYIHYSDDLIFHPINIKSKYSTPSGICTYPMNDIFWNNFINETVPFAANRKYVHILKINESKTNKILKTIEYNDADLENDARQLAKHDPTVLSFIKTVPKASAAKKLFYIIFRMAGGSGEKGYTYNSPNPRKFWQILHQVLKYDVVVDENLGVIHQNEPNQALFLLSKNIEHVEVLENVTGIMVETTDFVLIQDKLKKKIPLKSITNYMGDFFINLLPKAPLHNLLFENYKMQDIINLFQENDTHWAWNIFNIIFDKNLNKISKEDLYILLTSLDWNFTEKHINKLLEVFGIEFLYKFNYNVKKYNPNRLYRIIKANKLRGNKLYILLNNFKEVIIDNKELFLELNMMEINNFLGESFGEDNNEKWKDVKIDKKDLIYEKEVWPKVMIDEVGNKYWKNKHHELHRLDGPAIEKINGDKFWYKNDKLHRLDGPAIEFISGKKEYWINGKLHREDGPAIEYPNGDKTYWLNGVQVEEKDLPTSLTTTIEELADKF